MEENNLELINEENNSFEKHPLVRTNFFVSFCYLIIEVLIPGLVLFFLTSKDFSFTFKLPIWLMVVLSIALLLVSVMTTFIFYKFKLHHIDQFTYAVPFIFFIIALYLTSYWLDYHYFLIRFIIAFFSAVIGILFASIILLFILRRKDKKQFKNKL